MPVTMVSSSFTEIMRWFIGDLRFTVYLDNPKAVNKLLKQELDST